jgi:hypothetical protein
MPKWWGGSAISRLLPLYGTCRQKQETWILATPRCGGAWVRRRDPYEGTSCWLQLSESRSISMQGSIRRRTTKVVRRYLCTHAKQGNRKAKATSWQSPKFMRGPASALSVTEQSGVGIANCGRSSQNCCWEEVKLMRFQLILYLRSAGLDKE